MEPKASDAKPTPPATGIVLAGGKSERMGKNKALVLLRGKPLIEHAIERIRPLCSEVIVIANDSDTYSWLGVPILPDVIPDRGSLGGIYSGMVNAREPYVLAVACDMPFLNQDLLRFELSLAPEADVVVPRVRYTDSQTALRSNKQSPGISRPASLSDLHPMHAVYSKCCLPIMRTRIQAGDLRARSFFDGVKLRIVEQEEVDCFDPLHISVFNVNTAQDLQLAERLCAQVGSG